MSKITAPKVISFLWKNLARRYGSPRVIITDNGPQFYCTGVRGFCKELNIELCLSSFAHPGMNGQVENANSRILDALKKKVGSTKGRWAEMHPLVLWSYRTTPRQRTEDIPFSLVFKTEAIVPVETLVTSPRLRGYDEREIVEALELEHHLLEERGRRSP